ncbi:MAG: hypothetical protein ABEI11_00875 [Haloarculaceae archaeon]
MTAEPVRVVLAVALAAALVAVALPAVEEARESRRAALAQEAAADLRASIRGLVAREDPVHPGGRGARRIVSLRVPAGDAAVRVGVRTGPSDAVGWRTSGRRGRLPVGVDVRVGGISTPDGLTLREPGAHRLVLAFRTRDGREFVRVRRFKSGDMTTPHG